MTTIKFFKGFFQNFSLINPKKYLTTGITSNNQLSNFYSLSITKCCDDGTL